MRKLKITGGSGSWRQLDPAFIKPYITDELIASMVKEMKDSWRMSTPTPESIYEDISDLLQKAELKLSK